MVDPRSAHPARHLEAVDVGQAEVEDHRLEAGGRLQQVERRDPVGREVDDVAILGQEAGEQSGPGGGRPRRRAGAWRCF